MYRKITTKYGELLADVQKDKGQTVILDPKQGFKPVAVVQSTDASAVLQSLQKLGTWFNKRQLLESKGIKILIGEAFVAAVSPPSNSSSEPSPPPVKRGPGRPRLIKDVQ